MKFSMKNFFSKCEQIRRNLRIWSHLLKKSLMENFIFCAVQDNGQYLQSNQNYFSITLITSSIELDLIINFLKKNKQQPNMITILVPAFQSKFQVFEIPSISLEMLSILDSIYNKPRFQTFCLEIPVFSIEIQGFRSK